MWLKRRLKNKSAGMMCRSDAGRQVRLSMGCGLVVRVTRAYNLLGYI